MEGDDLPASFKAYLEHVAGERAYRKMEEQKFSTEGFEPPSYPSQFYWDVRLGFKGVSERHEASLREIRIPWLGFQVVGFPRRVTIKENNSSGKSAASI